MTDTKKYHALDQQEIIDRRLGEASGDPARLIQILSTEYNRLRSLEEVLYDYEAIKKHLEPDALGQTRSVHISDTIHAIQRAWAEAMIAREGEDA